MTGLPAMQNCRRLNRWYGRTLQTMDGDWVLRLGWWHWVLRPSDAGVSR